jgi:hypothetical protein
MHSLRNVRNCRCHCVHGNREVVKSGPQLARKSVLLVDLSGCAGVVGFVARAAVSAGPHRS